MAAKDYVWSFDLNEYTITKDVKEDYTASVQTRQSMTVADIARLIVAERTEFRAETIVNIANLVDEKIRDLLCQGHTVVTGSAVYQPSITGVFMGTTGTVDPTVNKCIVNVNPSQTLRTMVDTQVKARYSGVAKQLGGASIGLVRDVTTGLTDGTITPGGMLDVSGTKIRCTNADGTAIGNLFFINAETDSVAASVPVLAVNDPSRLVFTVPASLTAGRYLLKMNTFFSSNKTFLKEARQIVYPGELVVK